MEDEMLSPEQALSLHPVVAMTAAITLWIEFAASELSTGWERRCMIEELADTHSPEAAAALMANPGLLDAAWKRVDRKGWDRMELAAYLSRRALRKGREVSSLTAKQLAAVRYCTEQAAAKRAHGLPLRTSEAELVDLVGENCGSTWN